MWQSFRATASMSTTRLVLVVDRDDPTFEAYLPIAGFRGRFGWSPDAPFVMGLDPYETGDLVRATNSAAAKFWHRDEIIGHVGDDHLFRSHGWDRAVTDVMPGIAYGDDLWQGPKVPTAVFMSAVIPRSLGWYALPTCRHLFIDNAWKALGERMGVLHYLPEVIIEHVHPAAGKADWDDGYRAANSSEIFNHDRMAFDAWDIDSDLARMAG